MDILTLPGPPELEIGLRQTRSARRMSLRISSLDGRITLTIPRHVARRQALEFLHQREGWMREVLSQQKSAIYPAAGQTWTIAGAPYRLLPAQEGQRRVQWGEGTLRLPGPPQQLAPRLKAALRVRATEELRSLSDEFAQRLGRPYHALSLRDPRSRWGSCSAQGRLMYSWRLVLAPVPVMRYVAAHEVAHLEQLNHSNAFWRVVENLYGDTLPPRQWLHDHGADLHRYRFEPPED